MKRAVKIKLLRGKQVDEYWYSYNCPMCGAEAHLVIPEYFRKTISRLYCDLCGSELTIEKAGE